MALPLRQLTTVAAVFLVALGVLSVVNRPEAPPLPSLAGPAGPGAAGGASTSARIAALERAVRSEPGNARPYALLGDAYLQRARETGAPDYYPRAERAFAEALERDPRDVGAVTGQGALALARHDFRAALRHGLRARRLAPDLVGPYAVVVDAQLELGRYQEATRTLQRMVDLKPGLPSYARVSYVRELRGDLPGAVEAMRLAVSAGAGAPENVAYVQTLLGNLELERGRLGEAERAYRGALARFPDHVPAAAGLARLTAVRGNLPAAIRRYREVVARLPLPEYVIALGEAELAGGRRAAARRDLELVPAQQRLLATSGVSTDVDMALFEADHGSPRRAVAMARRAWSAAPSVRSAHALGWALTRAGRPREAMPWIERSLALGTRDPLFLYHAGIGARDAGRRSLARTYLRRALRVNPLFSPLHGPRAKRALEALA